MTEKLVVITGANTGIGKEAARALAHKGARIAMGSRDTAKGEAAAAEIRDQTAADVRNYALDLASFASIRAFAQTIRDGYEKIDVLILNAGLILGDRRMTQEGFESTFGVNHLGHFLLTELLLDRVRAAAPSRIVVVSSDAHRRARAGLDWDDLIERKKYGSFAAYSQSKLANILFTRELARRLEGTGVTVNALHPGVVATEFARGGDLGGIGGFLFKAAAPFFKTAAEGAATTIHLAASPDVASLTGRYFANSREVKPSRPARDDEAARRLWDESERLVASRAP